MNRVLWTAIGAVLLAAGVLGLLAGTGRLSAVDSQRTALTPEMVSAWNRNETTATVVTIVGGLLVALLGVLALRVLVRGPRGATIGDLYFQQSPPMQDEPVPVDPAGSTSVASRALHHALQRDLETNQQVRRAAIRLTGPTDHPQLAVRLAVAPDADIARVADHLGQAVDRFVATSGVRPDIADVVIRMPELTPSKS
jgi:hypothetical protein